ncbi:MAG: DUF5085 family protein [Sporolactobacillus sp.]
MIIENDSIELRNVVSRRYFIHYSKFAEAMEDFFQEISLMKLTPTGTFFYSLNNVPINGNMALEFFMAIEEMDIPKHEGLFFRSYFTVSNMLMTCLTGQFAQLTEKSYAELLLFMRVNRLEMASPIFHFFKGTRDFQYVELKVGVQDANGEE